MCSCAEHLEHNGFGAAGDPEVVIEELRGLILRPARSKRYLPQLLSRTRELIDRLATHQHQTVTGLGGGDPRILEQRDVVLGEQFRRPDRVERLQCGCVVQ